MKSHILIFLVAIAVNVNAQDVTVKSDGKVGIGSSLPNARLEVVGVSPGSVGGFASGIMQIRSSEGEVNGSASISGHNSNNGNTQLWFLGSSGSANQDIAFFNRMADKIRFGTDNQNRMTIDAAGNVGIGTDVPEVLLTIDDGAGAKAGITQGYRGGIATLEMTTSDGSTQTTRYEITGNSSSSQHKFYSGSNGAETELMRIDGSSGNVGIGTASPTGPLHVLRSGEFTAKVESSGSNDVGTTFINTVETWTSGVTGAGVFKLSNSGGLGSNDLAILPGGNVGLGTDAPIARLDISVSGNDGSVLIDTGEIKFLGPISQHRSILNENGFIRIRNTGGSINPGTTGASLFVVSPGGNGSIGVGISTPAFPLHMASGAHCTVAGNWVSVSDSAKKHQIADLRYGLSTVLQMQPKSYNYKIDASRSIGFIAQDLHQVIPEVVNGEEGDLGIAYGEITAVLVNAIKEQQAMIETQNSLIAKLHARVAQLEQGSQFESAVSSRKR